MSPRRTFAQDQVAAPIERAQALDRIAEPLQEAARRAVPEGSPAKEFLSGTWLGHPLHPALTDVVIGAWTSASFLDVLGGDRRRGADELVAVGALAAVPTALSGWSDWAELRGGSRRVGTVHALGNVTALSLQLLSLAARGRGRRGTGALLSLAALATGGFSAWLGGHLSFSRGVGVDNTVFDDLPTSWTSVIDDEKLAEGQLARRSAQGTGVLLIKHRGEVHALVDRCSHRGCSLSEGTFDGSAITCACHGSRFGLDGTLLRGPATASQPVLETRIRNGRVEVRAGGD